MKKSLSEKMFEQMERMRKMVFPPILEHALKQAEFEQKIQPKEPQTKIDISQEDLFNSLNTDIETLEEIKSIKDPLNKLIEITNKLSKDVVQNEKTSKRNFNISVGIAIFSVFISLYLGLKPVKIDSKQFNEIISSNKQYSLPNAETHLHASQTIIERKMTHHKNK